MPLKSEKSHVRKSQVDLLCTAQSQYSPNSASVGVTGQGQPRRTFGDFLDLITSWQRLCISCKPGPGEKSVNIQEAMAAWGQRGRGRVTQIWRTLDHLALSQDWATLLFLHQSPHSRSMQQKPANTPQQPRMSFKMRDHQIGNSL